MRVFYTHGLGGSPVAQPEIEAVLEPRGHTVIRVEVPHHHHPAELLLSLATMTFGDFCLMIEATADAIVRDAARAGSEDYAVIGDSLGGFVSAVAAQRDPRISHCVLLECSGDLCNALLNLDHVVPGLGALAGMFNLAGNGGLRAQAHRAIAGRSDFQADFERVNTFAPGRRARMRRLLILGDRRDPVMPATACRRFARGVRNSRVIMAYDEARHHPIGRDALERYAVPFLENRPLTLGDRVRQALGKR